MSRAIAQFFLKIEHLSFLMGPAPLLKMLKRLGDETSGSEQKKGVMQWTGIKFGARSRLLPWVSSIILVIYEVPEKRRLWFIFSLSYPP